MLKVVCACVGGCASDCAAILGGSRKNNPTIATNQRVLHCWAMIFLGEFLSHEHLNEKTIVLTKDSDKNWNANFTFEQHASNQLAIDGEMDTHKVHTRLELVDRKNLNQKFHWIAEYPFLHSERRC